MSVFETLNCINVNEHTEKKPTGAGNNRKELTYLSWTWAVTEVYKRYPDMTYQIKHWDGKPYLYDENLGYMVETSVTIEGQTKEMWLPVMDSHNAAMKKEEYEVETRFSSYIVQPASMMDINKAIMRCLTKNLAMFGLGTYIYAGEDLPETERLQQEEETRASKAKTKELNLCKAEVSKIAKKEGVSEKEIWAKVAEYIGKNAKDFDAMDWSASREWLQKGGLEL